MGEIDLLAVMIANQVDGILDDRHHAQAQQVDLDDAHVGAIVFVPLHHHAARHSRWLERHHGIELALADHHAARVLSQVPWQILHRQIQLEKFTDARIGEIQAGATELAVGRIFGIFPLPGAHQARKPIERGDFESQRLADLSRRGSAAISDDVGGHGRAQFSVALVDVLDDALALVARGQVDIDIRPLAAFFGKKALEQQLHADRVDCRDAQRITDGAIGRRAAPLRQDAVFAAELDQVPDDQKITGELQLFDHRQFALDLTLGLFLVRAVAAARAFIGPLAQE